MKNNRNHLCIVLNLFVFLVFILISGCSLSTAGTGEVRFAINKTITAGSTNQLMKSAVTDMNPATIIISIKQKGDFVQGFENRILNVTRFNDLVYTEAIHLAPGTYQLSEFIVRNGSNEALYVTPREGSEWAYLVSDPLDSNFTCTEGGIVTKKVEVVSVSADPGSYGYHSFSFDIVDTIQFDLAVYGINDETGDLELMTADLLISSNLQNELLVKPVIAGTNRVILPPGADQFSLSLTKEGYTEYNKTFSVAELRGFQNAPLIVELFLRNLWTISPGEVILGTGESITLTVLNQRHQDSGALNVYWSIESDIAEIGADGVLTALAPGNTRIKAVIEDQEFFADLYIIQADNPVKQNPESTISLFANTPNTIAALETVTIADEFNPGAVNISVGPSMTLEDPVVLEISYDNSNFTIGEGEEVIMIHSGEASFHIELENIFIDKEQKLIRFKVDHFSDFSVQSIGKALKDAVENNLKAKACLYIRAAAEFLVINWKLHGQYGSGRVLESWLRGTGGEIWFGDDIWDRQELINLAENKIFQDSVEQLINRNESAGVIPLTRYESLQFSLDYENIYSAAINKYYVQFKGTYEKISSTPEQYKVNIILYQEDYCNPEPTLSNILFDYIKKWPEWAQFGIPMDTVADWYLTNSPIYLPPGAKNYYIKSPEYETSITIEFQPASFLLSQGLYLETVDDLDQAVINEYGTNYRLADWTDLVSYNGDIEALFDSLGIAHSENLFVTNQGSHYWSGSRHYCITRNDHIVPSNYLEHAQINDHFVSLGSWYGISRKLLCVRK